MRRMVYTLAPLMVATAVLAGCGGSSAMESLTADAEIFDGLPRAVVEERLADPVLQENLRQVSTSERAGMAQLNVASAIFCRDALEQYQRWVSAGTPPTVPEVARPNNPEPVFEEFMGQWVEDLERAIDSGDPEIVRSDLMATGGCWSTVVDPHDPEARTVTDVLEGR
jgi:hypothetical protein